MKAIRFHEYGDPDVLRYEDVDRPIPGPGQVRVRVAGTSFNGVDANIRAGYMQGPMPLTCRTSPASTWPGPSTQLGDGVDDLRVGDPVVGFLPFVVDGAAAEYVFATADEPGAAPTSIPLADAAALPVVGLTAWQALFEHAGLQPGQRILINGASGAVGGYAVQLAKAAGAHVIATGSRRTATPAGPREPTRSSTTPPTTWQRDRPSRSTCCSTSPDHPRAARDAGRARRGTAGSWSTPPLDAGARPTRRAGYGASTSTSAATPPSSPTSSRASTGASSSSTSPSACTMRASPHIHTRAPDRHPQWARSSSCRPTTRGDPARLPSRRLGEGPTGTAS